MHIVPTLLYAAEIWGYKEYEHIERVHLFACNRFLHVCNKTPNDIVYGELGRYPLCIPATIRLVKFWLKLLGQTDNLYSKKSYKMLSEMHNWSITTWVSHVKSILCYYGFEQVWLFGCGNEKIFFNELKEKLYGSFCHGWRNHLESNGRLLFYKKYKNSFERETYVDFVWMDVYWNTFAQFRMGVSQINDHRHRFSSLLYWRNRNGNTFSASVSSVHPVKAQVFDGPC